MKSKPIKVKASKKKCGACQSFGGDPEGAGECSFHSKPVNGRAKACLYGKKR